MSSMHSSIASSVRVSLAIFVHRLTGKGFSKLNVANVGFMTVDHLAGRTRNFTWQKKFDGYLGSFRRGQINLLLLKPLTYMNRSGKSIAKAAMFYKVSGEKLIVIHDDMDLSFGDMKVKQGGGAAGHHGVESVIDELGSDDFCRIRIGIGRPTEDSGSDYVLSDFNEEEKEKLEEILKRAADAAFLISKEGVRSAMNRFNRRGGKCHERN